jgi:ATP-dependent exoDNAse (exonuclease V) alpha subunit
MSMVGCRLLEIIDAQMRDLARPRMDQPFGGLSVILIGDFFQLSPVQDIPLYKPRTVGNYIAGHNLYRGFEKAFQLTSQHRQKAESSECQRFRQLLLRLRVGTCTHQDWELLQSRVLHRIPVKEREKFSHAVRIFTLRDRAEDFNAMRITDALHPNVTMDAVIKGLGVGDRLPPDTNGGLQNSVTLAKGVRVILNTNLCTEAGLVNGLVGTVADIVYGIGRNPPQLPAAVMVNFDLYNGPTLQDSGNTVPIVPVERECPLEGYKFGTKLQIPLSLAFGLTVHKAQGATLDKVVVDLGEREFASGLSFVACSRTRLLSDMAFTGSFKFERLPQMGKFKNLQEKSEEEVRLSTLA